MLIMNLGICLSNSVKISIANDCRYKHELIKHKKEFKLKDNRMIYASRKNVESWREIHSK